MVLEKLHYPNPPSNALRHISSQISITQFSSFKLVTEPEHVCLLIHVNKEVIDDMSKKGKQKEVMEDDRDDDVQIDISLKSFINDQIEALQTALVAPEQEELDCTDKEHRGVEKAVKTIE